MGNMNEVLYMEKMENLLEIKYEQISTRFDAEQGVLWTFMNPKGVPCVNLRMLDDLFHHYKGLENSAGEVFVGNAFHPIKYVIFASKFPEIFNLGGDLVMFNKLIQKRDRKTFLHYATRCIDVMTSMITHYNNLPVTTISLIQGDALGGGFEAALASDIIIAERGSKMGFPEILFNLFPGMGAYSILARKLGTIQAERMLLNGKMYSAQEMHELGLVDVLAEDGEGEATVLEYVQRQKRRANGFQAIQRARQRANPITRQELLDITTIWVDAVLRLDESDLKMMNRLARSQQKLYGLGETPELSEPVIETSRFGNITPLNISQLVRQKPSADVVLPMRERRMAMAA